MGEARSTADRLRQFANFVRDTEKLALLRGRPGSNVKEKLCLKESAERMWYMFLHRTTFSPEHRSLITQLDALVSDGASSTSVQDTTVERLGKLEAFVRDPAQLRRASRPARQHTEGEAAADGAR